jgi:hypothetical protein
MHQSNQSTSRPVTLAEIKNIAMNAADEAVENSRAMLQILYGSPATTNPVGRHFVDIKCSHCRTNIIFMAHDVARESARAAAMESMLERHLSEERLDDDAPASISHDLIDELLSLGFEPRPYSGRFMYGEKCVAIRYCRGDEDLGIPRQNLVDSLGLDEIWYWPNHRWPEGMASFEVDEDSTDDEYEDEE